MTILFLHLTSNVLIWLLFVQIIKLHFSKFVQIFLQNIIAFHMNSAELVQFYVKPILLLIGCLAICKSVFGFYLDNKGRKKKQTTYLSREFVQSLSQLFCFLAIQEQFLWKRIPDISPYRHYRR